MEGFVLFNSSVTVQNNSSLSYKGGAKNCNLHLEITNDDQPDVVASYNITGSDGFVTFLNQSQSNIPNLAPTDFPFTIPDTLGATHTIGFFVFLSMGLASDTAGVATVTMLGTFSTI